tara:strand:- start:8174 stop:8722 length:549 start_codon:yes stop_codon:yes gene_type:complete
MNNSIVVAIMAASAFLVIAGAFGVFSTAVVVGVEAESSPVPTQVESSENANHGKHKEMDYTDVQCRDLFHQRPHGIPGVSAGYGSFYMRINRTKVVGADSDVIGFLELYGPRPGSVKSCSQKRDWTDCVCDIKTGMCQAEKFMLSYIGIKKGLQHPVFADPYSLISESTLFSMFKSMCLTGS